ncbi:MAG: glucosamine 6-phosphate synthetase [Pseudomonadales bacterium]|nr:glucosamine 6-phosphate synthetase [Pseudomonadales bacterium]
MCGIFGAILSGDEQRFTELQLLAHYAEQRGRDSSGLILFEGENYRVLRSDSPLSSLVTKSNIANSKLVGGHSRLATNGIEDNQPVVRDEVVTIHNGIICNADELWKQRKTARQLSVDTEIIPVIVKEEKEKGAKLDSVASTLFSVCEGVISAAVFMVTEGVLWLFSNNGSLYIGTKGNDKFFSSESFPLHEINCDIVTQVIHATEIAIPISRKEIELHFANSKSRPNFLPEVIPISGEENLLKYRKPDLLRCTRCILPETMPFIRFDQEGICNYCHNNTIRNQPKPVKILEDLVLPYRRKGEADCIVPFSGGRDSCYGLHLIVKELGMNPIAYTYDWGMISDLGRRNISRMCAALSVENIIVAADIELKRSNIRKNLTAWLNNPHLGMISLLTAGDKHFFRHVETVKKQTGISLNLWGINPLEVTHFKTGFLGIPPAFEEMRVYNSGGLAQLKYHSKRIYQMIRNPGYFNSSIYDTLSGEYWRSLHKKTDYFHVYDFWEWNETTVDETLAMYNWEISEDTQTTWRIGDATAAFYNYIYFTVAGFTEHDTFRSNQIREGAISRDKALDLVHDENRPRYESIKWYLQAVEIDFVDTIHVINRIPKLYA